MSEKSYAVPTGHRFKYEPSHPLAASRGFVYTARAVALATLGAGPFACCRCGVEVSWPSLRVVHIDGDGANDAPDNLAAACHGCSLTSRNTPLYDVGDGLRVGLASAARGAGISRSVLYERLRRGWSLEKALRTAVRPCRRRPARPCSEVSGTPPGAGSDFQPLGPDRAPSTTREFVDLGSDFAGSEPIR